MGTVRRAIFISNMSQVSIRFQSPEGVVGTLNVA